jgi:hypothetical protein
MRSLAVLLLVLVLAGCVTPTAPKADPRDPELIRTHKTVTYPTPR